MVIELKVKVHKAENLFNIEAGGLVKKDRKSDPFAIVTYDGKKFKTKVVDNELNPVWEEEFNYSLSNPVDVSSQLHVQIDDHEKVGKSRPLGQVSIPLGALLQKGSFLNQWYSLTAVKGEQAQGRVQLTITYTDPDNPPTGEGGDSAEGLAEDGVDGGEEGGEEGGGGGGTRRRRIANKKTKKPRPPLPNKPIDYQLRIHLLEGRALFGAKVDPVVKIMIGNQKKQSKVHKTNSNPKFNEYFVFNFHESPLKLFDELIHLKVYNARSFFKDALIGTFTLDVGMVFDEDDHMFANTWVMLSDIDSGDSSVRGFLKFTMTLLGPGDEAVIPPEETGEEDDEEIAKKILRPMGVELETIDLSFKFYSAEDVPQKDFSFKTGNKTIDKFTGADEKMYCDPYAKVIFAGKLNVTKVIDNTYFPEWNEEIHLLAQIPSMLNRIKIQTWDSDTPAGLVRLNIEKLKAADDVISTSILNLNEISSVDPDLGFLPTFGPAYMCMYGGPRKFQTIYDDHLKRIDEGVGEGMSYRGRVLLELSSKSMSPEEKIGPNTDLLPSEIERVAPFLKRIEYHLRLVLVEANFLNPKVFESGDITFEISIGVVGNTDMIPDGQPNPVNSTTFPTTSVLDGAYYRLLNWDNKKPCVELVSEWEDVLYRIRALNAYKYIGSRLDQLVKEADILMTPSLSGEIKDEDADKARDIVLRAIDNLIIDCQRPIPPLPEKYTLLDQKLQEKRNIEKTTALDFSQQLRDDLEIGQCTIQEAIDDLKALKKRFELDAVDPQTSIPDVIVWLLHKGERAAYHRFSIVDYMWSKNEHERGPLFGQAITVFLKSPKARPKKPTKDMTPGQIQLRIWFGPKETLNEWPKLNGQFVVLAESYENNRYIPMKGWGDILLPTDPPKFSDKRGKEKKFKNEFKEPEGWVWNGDWYIDPDLPDIDIYGDQESVIIEVFENERKQPIVGYCKTLLPSDPSQYSDRQGTEKRTMEDVQLPIGWKWTSHWQVDMTRAVDKDGWEYAGAFSSEFHANPKKFDFVRRKRWFIERVKDPEYKPTPQDLEKEKDASQDHGEGWLYAIDFFTKFKTNKNLLDSVRRRRWHRELICSPKEKKTLANLPSDFPAAGTFISYKGNCKYQLRAHMYQGRDLPAEDANGFSDAFCRISFSGASGRTILIEKSVTPTWDHTVLLEVTLYGNSNDPLELYKELNSRVVVELYDKDFIGDDDFLGRFTAQPVYRDAKNPAPGVLEWFASKRLDDDCGDILCVFELIPLKDAPKFPLPKPVIIKEPITRKKLSVIRLPEDVRPELQPCEIEILTWGLRNLRRVYFLNVSKPHIAVECGGVVKESPPIKSMKNFPNFEASSISFTVDLPKKEIYSPPMNLRVFDNRKFGRKPLVGSIAIKSMKPYRARYGQDEVEIDYQKLASVANLLLTEEEEPEVPAEKLTKKKKFGGLIGDKLQRAKKLLKQVARLGGEEEGEPDESIDWWTKYFSSVGEGQTGPEYLDDLMDIYQISLERKYDFETTIKTFTLLKGKTGQQDEMGTFKGNFRVVVLEDEPRPDTLTQALEKRDERGRVPHPWGNLPDKTAIEVFVRVYIVRGIELQPRDSNGKSDPFCILQFGKKKPINDKENYIARNLNPLFGRVFEMDCVLPRDADLLIQVFDYDMIGANEIIGETKIDLESRMLSRKRATVGLAKTYQAEGICKWRDILKPTEILERFCETHSLSAPEYNEYIEGEPITCTVKEINGGNGFTFTTPEMLGNEMLAKENSALMCLHFIGLVREHVETRTLYDPMQPDMDQGKLQLWIDMFPKVDGAPPPPVDISPRKPKSYELRVVIYNTVEVDMKDVSFAGEEMSDIYIKAYLRGMEDEKQKTDVHYRSLNGEGNFNWRLLFPFKYIPAEEQIVVEKRAHIFSKEYEVTKVDPVLSLQLWDADIFGPDEFIGSIDIELNDLFMPAKSSRSAKVKQEGKIYSETSLFTKKRIQGWYATTAPINPKRCTGKIECEIELLTVDEVQERPAGKARDDPNQYPELDPPKRPATSFMWFTSPWKTLKYIIWKNYKWYIIGFLILLIIVIAIVIFVYTAPQSLMDQIVSAIQIKP